MYVIGSFKKRANTALREVLDWLANQGVPLAYTPDLHFSKVFLICTGSIPIYFPTRSGSVCVLDASKFS